MMSCVPCAVGNCDSCTTRTGESIGLPCQCEHSSKKPEPKPGVRVVRRPRSMK